MEGSACAIWDHTFTVARLGLGRAGEVACVIQYRQLPGSGNTCKGTEAQPSIFLAYLEAEGGAATTEGAEAAAGAAAAEGAGAWSAYRRSHTTRASCRGGVIVVGIVCVEGWTNEQSRW